jgi:hypothetical protein
MFKIVIDSLSEKSANFLKEEIEKTFPLIDGKVEIIKDSEIKTLDKLIEENKNKGG